MTFVFFGGAANTSTILVSMVDEWIWSTERISTYVILLRVCNVTNAKSTTVAKDSLSRVNCNTTRTSDRRLLLPQINLLRST